MATMTTSGALIMPMTKGMIVLVDLVSSCLGHHRLSHAHDHTSRSPHGLYHSRAKLKEKKVKTFESIMALIMPMIRTMMTLPHL